MNNAASREKVIPEKDLSRYPKNCIRKDFCRALRLTYGKSKMNYEALKANYFTDDFVKQHFNLSPEQFRKKKVFISNEVIMLARLWYLSPEDFE